MRVHRAQDDLARAADVSRRTSLALRIMRAFRRAPCTLYVRPREKPGPQFLDNGKLADGVVPPREV
jgi:hypothetical protein